MQKKRVSMEDVARHTGFSRATVSYVLNGRLVDSISESTRQKVQDAAREMGYRPNRFALALKQQKTDQIEICTHDLHPAFYSRVLYEFSRQLAPSPYDLRIQLARDWTEADWAGDAGLWPADGIIAFDAQLSDAHLAALLSRKTPVVCAGTNYRTEVDHVGVDLLTPARQAVRYLINSQQPKNNACRILFLRFLNPQHEAQANDQTEARLQAYYAEMKAARLKPQVLAVTVATGESYRQAARSALREYIAENGAPDSVFAYTDELAIGAMVALRDLNLRVPGDVSIIGCDGIEDGEYQSPSLSTIIFPYTELAQLTWEFLQHRIAEPDAPQQSALLMPKLALRQSSGAAI